MMTPEEFYGIVANTSKEKAAFKLGTIPAGYVSGRPTIKFDGETAAGSRTYPYLSSYTPAANDRVIVAMVNNSGVVLGKII